MRRVGWSSEVFNCSAPDTGNIELLHRFATPEQTERWLDPLLAGAMRSCFAMSEPNVASSDPTQIATRIEPDAGCRRIRTTGQLRRPEPRLIHIK